MTIKHLITTQDWELNELKTLIDNAFDLKKKKNQKNDVDPLKNKTLIMIFYNPSTRTRTSFEIAMTQLGGHAIFMSSEKAWIGQESESVKDTARVLSRYGDIIAIRMFPNATKWIYGASNNALKEFCKNSTVPIINLEDDMFHPCQALSDIMTIKEFKGNLKNKKITISWAYHPKPLPMSVVNSILLTSTRFGLDVTLTHPKGFDLSPQILDLAKKNSEEQGGKFQVVYEMEEGYSDADIVYVKSWGAFKHYGNFQEEKRLRQPYRKKWICNEEIMEKTRSDSIFMHCLPVRRNIVVTDEVIDGPHSVVYDQAENRLHLQKAILLNLIA
ncbi:MAG: N-acetylornithine carbamoyltransferase [Candidatus Helarchaeota archaeon]